MSQHFINPHQAEPAPLPVREAPESLSTAQHFVDPVALQRGADQAQEVLCQVKTVFPFTLFRDTIVIDRMKATIMQHDFFGHARVQSVQIEDILNVEANSGPFFGQVRIWTRFFENRPLVIRYLRRADVATIKQLLQGYSIARHQKLATASMPRMQLVPLLLRLGQASSES